MPAGNVSVTANWLLIVLPFITCDVCFDACGGSTPVPGIRTVNIGEPYGTLPFTERTGYSFDGWYTEAVGGSLITESTLVTNVDDHSLFAHWTAIGYMLIVNGSHSAMPGDGTFYYGNTVTIDAGTRSGYDFAGWSVVPTSIILSDASAQSTSFVMPAGNVTVTAGWSPVVVTPPTLSITFNANGGSPALPTLLTVTVGEPYGLLASTTRAGYSFDGWFTELTSGSQIIDTTIVTSTVDHTLYAHWTAIAYGVTVADSHDGFAGSNNYYLGDTVTIYAGSAAGFEFVSWSSESTAVIFANASDATTTFIMPAENVTVRALWRINSYMLTVNNSYALNSGSGSHLFNSNVIVSAGNNPGYVFTSWTVDFGSVTLANLNAATTTLTMPASDVTITASWIPLSGVQPWTYFTITFVNWNGEVLSTQSIREGDDAVAPVYPSRDGYRFTGWSTGFTRVSSDLTVRALFSPVAPVVDPPQTLSNTGSTGNGNNNGNQSSNTNNSGTPSNTGSTSETPADTKPDSSNAADGTSNTGLDSSVDNKQADVPDALAETGVGTLGLDDSPVALSAGDAGLAVANVVCTLLGAILAVILIVRSRKHKLGPLATVSVVLGLGGLLMFFLTENVGGQLSVTDRWTTVSAIILMVESISLLVSLRSDAAADQ